MKVERPPRHVVRRPFNCRLVGASTKPGDAALITIVSGLFEGQVWQRNRRGVSAAEVAGRCAVNGPVWARVLRGTRPLPGFAAHRVGQARRGRFAIRVTGVPAGGPYTVVLSVGKTPAAAEASLTVREIRVGDVWVLAGQSNMQGSGLRNAPLKPEVSVRAFYMDDRWALADDPLHNLWNAVDPVHGGNPDGRDDGGKGVGPGLSFGHAMFAYTGVPQGLIACAHWGSSMPQWDPMHQKLGGFSLYGAMLRRVRKNGGRVAGVVWYQGESEAMPDAIACYAGRMRNLVAHIRRDFLEPRLPFAMVQLARYAGQDQNAANWNAVQDLQRRLPLMIPYLTTVPAVDLALDDMVHVSGSSQRVLGRRLAEAMHALRAPGGTAAKPIAFKGLRLHVAKGDNHATVEVEYAHVVGRLESPVRPVGFHMMEEGRDFPSIFDIRLDGTKVILKTFRPIPDFVGKTLHYAAGLDPATTITDGAGRPLPVMGPIALMGLRRPPAVVAPERATGLDVL